MAIAKSLTQLRTLLAKIASSATHVPVSSTNASPSVVTDTAHGYSTGDFIVIAGHATNTALNGPRTVVVVDANSYSLLDAITGAAVNGNGVGGATGTVQRLAIGLTPGDLEDIQASLATRPNKVLGDNQRANESTIQTVLGL